MTTTPLASLGSRAKVAARELAKASSRQKDAALATSARLLRSETDQVLSANSADIARAHGAGASATVDLRQLMSKRAVLRASTLRARPLEEKATAARLVERHVLPLVRSGKVRVPVAASFPLEQAEEAYARFASGKLGKIVLEVG